MRSYIIFAFICGIINLLFEIARISSDKYPIQRSPRTLGSDVSEVIITICLLLWVSVILFR